MGSLFKKKDVHVVIKKHDKTSNYYNDSKERDHPNNEILCKEHTSLPIK